MSPRTREILMRAVALALAATPAAVLAQEGSVEERLARIERVLNNNTLLQMLDEIQAMRTDLRSLRGEVELQAHQAEQLKSQNKAQYLDLDERLKRIESQLFAATDEAPPGQDGDSSPEAGASADPFGNVPSAGGADPSAGDALYEAAFEQLKSGRYGDAAAGFQTYIRDYPGGRYNANARYWLGETHYVEQRYSRALETFSQLIASYPASEKAADAMLKSGYILHEQGRRDRARQMLNDVVNQYPNTRAAELALERLAQLGN